MKKLLLAAALASAATLPAFARPAPAASYAAQSYAAQSYAWHVPSIRLDACGGAVDDLGNGVYRCLP